MGDFFAVLTGVFWAFYSILVRRGTGTVSQEAGLLIANTYNAVFNLILLTVYLTVKTIPPLNWTGVLYFLAAGLFTTFIGRLFFFQSIAFLGPSRAGIFKLSYPAFTLLLAIFILGERIGPLEIAGVVIVFAGIGVLVKEKLPTPASREAAATRESLQARGQVAPTEGGVATLKRLAPALNPGILFGLTSGISFGAGMILRKTGMNALPDSLLGATLGSLSALGAFLIWYAVKGQIRSMAREAFGRFNWPYSAAGVVGGLALLSLFISLDYISLSRSNMVSTAEIPFTILLTRILLPQSETLTSRVLAGAGLVVLGALMVMAG
ncbi:MAG: DMT family transporter [Actinobacteria bacterium]|nr:DMT family transporter [Actinomycetota bacterium]